MSARRDADVIVAGAGPAGAYVAHALARGGADVVLLDRARFPRDKPCSEYLSPEAARLLDAMGALEAVEAASPSRLAVTLRLPRPHWRYMGIFQRVSRMVG